MLDTWFYTCVPDDNSRNFVVEEVRENILKFFYKKRHTVDQCEISRHIVHRSLSQDEKTLKKIEYDQKKMLPLSDC